MSRNRKKKKVDLHPDVFNINDLVLYKNGRKYYIADTSTTDSGQNAYRLSNSKVPNLCGTLNWWAVFRELELIERA